MRGTKQIILITVFIVRWWIGYVGVTRMEGSYFNVMGFPICHVYERLKKYLR